MPVFSGTEGYDRLLGTDTDDRIIGLGGDDELYGFGGDDTLLGGEGNDTLSGGEGNDVIDGGDGIDELVEVAPGWDFESDFYLTDTELQYRGFSLDYTKRLMSIETATLMGGSRMDASGFSGRVLLLADYSSVLIGGHNNDTLVGSRWADVLSGGLGNDVIDGGEGFDILRERGDVNFTLTSSRLVGLGSDSLISIEGAHLRGGQSANRIDASSFNGGTKLWGEAGDDTLLGGRDQNELYGGKGNDLLISNSGDDLLFGGLGDDTLVGGSGIDTVVESIDSNLFLTNTRLTGSGIDQLTGIEEAELYGGMSNNRIDASGFSGHVLLEGLGGDDSLLGGKGGDALFGGKDNDYLYGGRGSDALWGGEGDETLIGGEGDDFLKGEEGFDLVIETGDFNYQVTPTLTPTPIPAQLLIGNGRDRLSSIELLSLSGGGSANRIDASLFAGQSILMGRGGNDRILGGSSHDEINGGDGADILTGNAGNDTLIGGDGRDWLIETGDVDFALSDLQLTGLGTDALSSIEVAQLNGGTSNNTLDASRFSGNVFLFGEGGSDRLLGSRQDDYLNGGEGSDTLEGNDGRDSIFALAGHDRLSGGLGDDTLNGGTGVDTVIESADVNFRLTDSTLSGLGTDQLISIEMASLEGGGSDNVINTASFSGSAKLLGHAGRDILIAGTGWDSLWGGADNDLLIAGAGDDWLNGGWTAVDTVNTIDTLNGGLGRDTFVLGYGNQVYYNDGFGKTTGETDYALIQDFNKFQDRIQLSGNAKNYALGTFPIAGRSGTAILRIDPSEARSELIAIVQGSTALNLGESYFHYTS